jgi:hypothetical protein
MPKTCINKNVIRNALNERIMGKVVSVRLRACFICNTTQRVLMKFSVRIMN